MEKYIRLATISDVEVIQELIAQLGYPHSIEFIQSKLDRLFASDSDMIFVYEHNSQVVGLITLHFSIQLAFEGDIASIGYLVVDEKNRGMQVGKKLEEYCTQLAKEKQCSFIEVFSLAERTDAHRFYIRQGYAIADKYFSKELSK